MQRYQQDLHHIQPLGRYANQFDELFYHRLTRTVRRDGTVSYEGQFYEVPCELMGQRIQLVIDPHTKQPLTVESAEGETLGAVTPLDRQANNTRRRQRPQPADETPASSPKAVNVVEMALQQQTAKLALPMPSKKQEK